MHAPTLDPSLRPPRQAPRVLVVEDEALIALDIERAVAALGYVVAGSAASGEEALETAEREHPDIVLMDIHLKGELDGIEAAARLRAQCRVPVVYLTSHSDDATLERAVRSRPYGFVLKPFHDLDLRVALEIALSRYRAETRLNRQNQRLLLTSRWEKYRAETDELTGLRNRRGFLVDAERELQRALAEGRPLALMFADVDGLKPVNDRFGHAVGDELLIDTARALVGALRDTDLIGRLGGDEFAALLVDCDATMLTLVRRRLESQIEAFNSSAARPYKLSLSLGFASAHSSAGNITLQTILRQADHEMYRARGRAEAFVGPAQRSRERFPG